MGKNTHVYPSRPTQNVPLYLGEKLCSPAQNVQGRRLCTGTSIYILVLSGCFLIFPFQLLHRPHIYQLFQKEYHIEFLISTWFQVFSLQRRDNRSRWLRATSFETRDVDYLIVDSSGNWNQKYIQSGKYRVLFVAPERSFEPNGQSKPAFPQLGICWKDWPDCNWWAHLVMSWCLQVCPYSLQSGTLVYYKFLVH